MHVLLFLVCLVLGPVSVVPPNEDPTLGATNAGQAVADVLKSFAGADAALIPAGVIAKSLQKNDLSTVLTFPTDGVIVIELTGSQVKTAFERSVALLPQPNVGFLQLAGFEVTYNPDASPNSRVTNVTLNGSKLEDGRSYDVAMPTSLQRGQLGYSNLWDKAKIVRSFAKANLGTVLKGQHVASSPSRWLRQG
jgi:2',3'-cyclic-nucleotide 2'-phosphodiesterase (5'-nucleotidase family)